MRFGIKNGKLIPLFPRLIFHVSGKFSSDLLQALFDEPMMKVRHEFFPQWGKTGIWV